MTRKLYAAEAGTDNDEAEVPTALIGISCSLGMLHLVDDMLAKINRISHDLKAKRMVGHSWDDTQAGFGAAGNHQMVVVQDEREPFPSSTSISEERRSILCTREAFTTRGKNFQRYVAKGTAASAYLPFSSIRISQVTGPVSLTVAPGTNDCFPSESVTKMVPSILAPTVSVCFPEAMSETRGSQQQCATRGYQQRSDHDR